MTTAEAGCLLPDGPPGADEADEKARAHAAERLRCASRLTCVEAVRCSDDAMARLRRLLGGRPARR